MSKYSLSHLSDFLPCHLTAILNCDRTTAEIVPSVPGPQVREKTPEPFGLKVTISQNIYDKLRYVEELLGHRMISRDLAQVVELALEALIEELEKDKAGPSSRPRRG